MKLKVAKIGEFRAYYRNKDELDRIKKEIFADEEYKFTSNKPNPFIIDGGSHIGLSILYFKSIYPKARILGFEPNPENFQILQRSIEENKLKNVKLVNAALSDKNGKDILRATWEEEEPWTWGDTVIENMWGDEEESRKVEVRTVRLSRYINKRVDLLKLDVEGSEQKVLEEIRHKLRLVERIILEFHGTPASKDINNYQAIKGLLEDNSFKIKTYTKDKRLALLAHLRNTTTLFTIKATRD